MPIGVYAVVAPSVVQRRREIGIRLLLAAPKTAVLQLVFRENAPLIFVSAAAGVVCRFVTLSQIRAFLHDSLANSASITIAAAIFVAAVALIACC